MLRIFTLIIFIFSFIPQVNKAQIESVSPGIAVGIGEIKGNSASVTSFGSTIFFDFTLWFSNDVTFRTGFTYARKIEYLLPENRMGRYYPFIKSFSLKGVIKQNLTEIFYLEQGAGIIILNDRTFGDINEWEPGASFSALAGINLINVDNYGFLIGLGLDYGITFTKTTASYYLVYIQAQYFF